MFQPKVTMRWFEILLAAGVGVRRRLLRYKKLEDGIPHEDTINEDSGWAGDIEGAIAEMAFAKAMGLYWDGSVDSFKMPDVKDIYVRWTEVESGHLPIRPKDKDGVYVLVTGLAPYFIVRGWMTKETAYLHPEWAYTGRGCEKKPCQWVDQKDLNPMTKLEL